MIFKKYLINLHVVSNVCLFEREREREREREIEREGERREGGNIKQGYHYIPFILIELENTDNGD